VEWNWLARHDVCLQKKKKAKKREAVAVRTN
jgi:hypothetical protein